MDFEWDPDKALRNARKHGVEFDEAATAFRDPLSITIPDFRHSAVEQRYVLLGQSERGRLLVVMHTDRGNTVRIISARMADSRERRRYEEGDVYDE